MKSTRGKKVVKHHQNQNGLFISEIMVLPIPEEKRSGKTVAFVRIKLNDVLQLTGLRIMEGVSGLFVAYPLDGTAKGDDYTTVYYPLTRECREYIENSIIEEYIAEIINSKAINKCKNKANKIGE